MKKIMMLLNVGLLISTPALAETKCFLLKENNKTIKEEGECKSRYSPRSTFKIVLSLMGYDSGVLIDETHPIIPFKQGYADKLEQWKQPHEPQPWMKNSCLWYSHFIAQELGANKFKDYIAKFNYGNMDVSGDKGKNNMLSYSWIDSSLQISPEEQAIFLQKIIDNALPVSEKSMKMTKNIIFIDELADGWRLYGKTGTGNIAHADGTLKTLQAGWFVGWIQKGDRTVVFTHYIEDKEKYDTPAGPRAKEMAKEKLTQMIQNHLV